MEDQKFNVESNEYQKLLWARVKADSSGVRIEYVLRLYVLAGLIVALGGLGYFILSTLNIQLTAPQRTAMLFMGTGLGLSTASWFLLKFRKQRSEDQFQRISNAEQLSEFINALAHFEDVSKEALSSREVSFNRFSIRQVIELLRADEKLSREDVMALDEAMHARNALLHGGEKIPTEFLAKHTRAVTEVSLNIAKALAR
jgi:hypothetical protein